MNELIMFALTIYALYLPTLSHDRSPSISLIKQYSIYLFYPSINESPDISTQIFTHEYIHIPLLGLMDSFQKQHTLPYMEMASNL